MNLSPRINSTPSKSHCLWSFQDDHKHDLLIDCVWVNVGGLVGPAGGWLYGGLWLASQPATGQPATQPPALSARASSPPDGSLYLAPVEAVDSRWLSVLSARASRPIFQKTLARARHLGRDGFSARHFPNLGRELHERPNSAGFRPTWLDSGRN